MTKSRLLRLADWLERQPGRFDPLAWVCLWPELRGLNEAPDHFLGITLDESKALFGDGDDDGLQSPPTGKEIAADIRAFVERGGLPVQSSIGVGWAVAFGLCLGGVVALVVTFVWLVTR